MAPSRFVPGDAARTRGPHPEGWGAHAMPAGPGDKRQGRAGGLCPRPDIMPAPGGGSRAGAVRGRRASAGVADRPAPRGDGLAPPRRAPCRGTAGMGHTHAPRHTPERRRGPCGPVPRVRDACPGGAPAPGWRRTRRRPGRPGRQGASGGPRRPAARLPVRELDRRPVPRSRRLAHRGELPGHAHGDLHPRRRAARHHHRPGLPAAARSRRSAPRRAAAEFRFIGQGGGAAASSLGIEGPGSSGFGCESADVLHVERRSENEIVLTGCTDFPNPLVRCPRTRAGRPGLCRHA